MLIKASLTSALQIWTQIWVLALLVGKFLEFSCEYNGGSIKLPAKRL